MTAKAFFVAITILCGANLLHAAAEELESTVELVSGRKFRGFIDGASSNSMLVLRTESAGITLKRRIDWDRVTRLETGGAARDISRLRAELGAAATRAIPARIPMKLVHLQAWPAAPVDGNSVDELAQPQPRVATVAFDSQVANWDADVETDGVIVDVAPVDLAGNLLPLAGTLEVELFAPQRRTLDLAPQSGGDTLELVERWTRAISPDDYGPRGARVLLPFGAITPELQPNWTASSYGMVHARLAVPGQGVFDSSRDGVRIRPWAPNRDRLEMKTGQRFLPTEILGRRD